MTTLLGIADWAAALGLLGLGLAGALYAYLKKRSVGTPLMEESAEQIRAGAMAFLRRQHSLFGAAALVAALLLGWAVGLESALAFLGGALGGVLAAFAGVESATRANVRCAAAADEEGQGEAQRVAFLGGASLGLAVAGLGLVGLGALYWQYASAAIPGTDELPRFAGVVSAFALGATFVALFARVAGGIYANAADVGADLAGQLEAELPEDDPRNPATLADNVGDQVSDVAGMAADVFAAYVTALAATMAIGGTSAAMLGNASAAAALPLLTGMVGLLASLVGIAAGSVPGRGSSAGALRNASLIAAGVFLAAMYLVVAVMDLGVMDPMTARMRPSWGTWASLLTGAVAGILIGLVTEYYTAAAPVRRIAAASQGAAATNLITGLSVGLQSTAVPIGLICASIVVAYQLGGLYGIALAGVASLATVGATASVDAYGPIADSARGVAEMSQLPPESRALTGSLDSIGDQTSALGKGLVVGSAGLTALALFGAYGSLVGLTQNGINLVDPYVVIGLLLGGLLPFLVAAFTLGAVGRAAADMLAEVRRQLREVHGIREGRGKPDTARCIEISSRAATRDTILPCATALAAPVLVGFGLGVSALGGLLVGAMVSGLLLALFVGNAGGAWDHAKRYIQGGALGGKGSPAHHAAVVADAVGDPLKSLVGPALVIVVRLVALLAVVLAPWLIRIAELRAAGDPVTGLANTVTRLFG